MKNDEICDKLNKFLKELMLKICDNAINYFKLQLNKESVDDREYTIHNTDKLMSYDEYIRIRNKFFSKEEIEDIQKIDKYVSSMDKNRLIRLSCTLYNMLFDPMLILSFRENEEDLKQIIDVFAKQYKCKENEKL
jgi:hypothetical protein